MKEEIKNTIDDIFNNQNPTLNDIYSNNTKEDISNLVNNQNEKATEDIMYRKELFDKLQEIKDLGFKIEYNDQMTNEELENLINSVQY